MKSRKVLTILLSLAIMFTFMPAMAFATDSLTYAWDTDTFNSVAVTSGGTTTTYTHIKKEQDSTTGEWVAYIDSSAYSYSVPDSSAVIAYYVDLTGATLGYVSSTGTTGTFATEYTSANFSTLTATLSDGYATAYPIIDSTKKAATTPFKLNLSGFTGTVTGWEDFDSTSTDAQSFTLALKSKFISGTTNSADNPYVIGTPNTKAVNVAGATQAASSAKFYLNEVDTTAESASSTDDALSGYYTGAEQTVVMGGVTGYNVAYSVWNSSTGKYDSVDAVTITNAGSKNAVEVKAVVTNASKASDTVTAYFTVTLTAAVAPRFEFDKNGNDGDYAYKVDGTEYTATDYVIANYAYASDSKSLAANKAATSANETELKALFDDCYEVKEEVSKSDENTVNLSFASKLGDMTSAEVKALNTKYATLLTNFGVSAVSGITYNSNSPANKATITLNAVKQKDDNIEISAVSKVTYSGKKTTKKGVLKKAQTIAVKATADSGKEVSYKLVDAPSKITIDKSTGKITVKKGLKKGTYKFFVKVTTAETYAYAAATEYHTIKVIVKK